MRVALVVLAALLIIAVASPAATIEFGENRGQAGLVVSSSSDTHVDVAFKLDSMNVAEVDVAGVPMQQITIPGVILPNEVGAPDLPGLGRFIAVPQGATARLEILSLKSQVFEGFDVIPAAQMPFENDDSPLTHEKDPAIYGRDAFYPDEPVRLSDPMSLRGVDSVVLGISPFQYNPVTRELIVYTDVEVRVTFDGGTGHFGDDRLRSRYWEPVLEANLANYSSLPEIDFDARASSRDDEYEYVIVVPDDPTYIAWADSLKRWRTLQGIDTGVVTLTETGATYGEIESWVNTAYNTWSTPPAAILLLADYVASGQTSGITCPSYSYYSYTCVTDNKYADVNGDHLPDIAFARMTANPSNIEMLVRKAIDYERNPPVSADYYHQPVVACGWQTERWFTICTEIVYGFLHNVLGKAPTREYAIYSGTPSGSWSSNGNTYMLVDYFGPDGLGYIPATPDHLTDWGGSATRLNGDINRGAFIVQHRDHGGVTGWGEPEYDTGDLSGLSNENLTFVFSINCLTGKYNVSGQCFAEAFHRMNHGALGLIAASETSMSFVNDAFVFGIYDLMWPEFDPGYPARGRDTGPPDLRPAFANASGKYYLEASNWPSNPEDKELTFYLFHHHGDAFTTLYSEVPQELTVSHQGVLPVGAATFQVTADEGSMIALTVDGEIVGVAEGTGAPLTMAVDPVSVPGTARLTVTKANYYRHSEDVPVIYPVTYEIAPATVPVSQVSNVTVTVWDSEGSPLPNVVITIDGWGILPVSDTTDGAGQAHLTVSPPYGEDLVVTGREIGQTYDALADVLPVTGAAPLTSADIGASVPSIGLYGSLTPFFEGQIVGSATEDRLALYALGCGVDEETAGSGSAVTLLVTPTSTGTIHAALAKRSYRVYLEDIAVDVVYGQVAGEVYEASRAPIAGAKIKVYAADADTSVASPLYEAESGGDGAYAIGEDIEVGYYDVYVLKFGYLTHASDLFVQYADNDVDFYLDAAPAGLVHGCVTEAGTGRPLGATISLFRADNMTLYSETVSDSLAGGYYEVSLPYFNYLMRVRAYHHMPENLGITVDEPSEPIDFVLEQTLGSILVLSDGVARGEDAKIDPKSGAPLEAVSGGADGTRSAGQIAADLVDLGFDVVEETAGGSDPATWFDYDLIVSASGDNHGPVASSAYRTALEDYVRDGGKLLIEGGEVGYDADMSPGYPTFKANVLHIADWIVDSSGNLTVYDNAHPVTTFPNTIGAISFTYDDYGDEDANVVASDAAMVCSWSGSSGNASVIVYDDNPNPASGQVVYFCFNYTAASVAQRVDLLENTIIYLLTPESPPTGSISGTVMLEGETDHSGVRVTAYPGGAYAFTDASGYYLIDEMYPATYTVRAAKDEWSTGEVEGVVVYDGQLTSGVNMVLFPIVEFEHCESPELAIPDNVPAGVYDTLTYTEDIAISDVEVYVNLTHTYIGDLIVAITSPDGTTVRLHNRTGGSANDIIGWYDSQLTVDGPGELADFVGEGAAGDWQIWVSDNAGVDTGVLHDWCVHVWGGASSGVPGEDLTGVPSEYVLKGASPNPFNPVTEIAYGLPADGRMALRVYNVAGKLVRVLVDGDVDAGYHAAVWDGRDDRGEPVASGVYFCRMEAEAFEQSVKMVLLK
jgi:subtilisin-like proprotein convertase family protein